MSQVTQNRLPFDFGNSFLSIRLASDFEEFADLHNQQLAEMTIQPDSGRVIVRKRRDCLGLNKIVA